MFSFQNHSRRMDFRVKVSFRITTCFTLYTLWKPRILSKHAISVFADAPRKRTDKAMIFIDFWHFPISQKCLLAIPQLFIARKCREFFASSVGFELDGFKRNSGRMLRVTCSWSAPSNRIFRVPLVTRDFSWDPNRKKRQERFGMLRLHPNRQTQKRFATDFAVGKKTLFFFGGHFPDVLDSKRWFGTEPLVPPPICSPYLSLEGC